MIKCFLDPSIHLNECEGGKCIYCCIYCDEKDKCECACQWSDKSEEYVLSKCKCAYTVE